MTQVSCTPLGFPQKIRKMDIQVIHASANNWHACVCLVPVIPSVDFTGTLELPSPVSSIIVIASTCANISFYFNRDTEIQANMCLYRRRV